MPNPYLRNNKRAIPYEHRARIIINASKDIMTINHLLEAFEKEVDPWIRKLIVLVLMRLYKVGTVNELCDMLQVEGFFLGRTDFLYSFKKVIECRMQY